MPSPICTIGDTHGHLQLALCMAACWQRERNITFDAVFLCGDVGTFTSDEQLDDATRRLGEPNPCELEFLYQWLAVPFPNWLQMIFAPTEHGGMGLTCPVVMVHGNHEGFSHLQTLVSAVSTDKIVEITHLPTVDRGGFIRYLPNGCRCRTQSDIVVGGIGGIDIRQRVGLYPDMAYFDDAVISQFRKVPPVDLLITHQGPSEFQGDGGSAFLQELLKTGRMRCWCHSHSVQRPGIATAGPSGRIRVVPLKDATFMKSSSDPGRDCFAAIHFDSSKEPPQAEMIYPKNWGNYHQRNWFQLDGNRLVCPDLAQFVES